MCPLGFRPWFTIGQFFHAIHDTDGNGPAADWTKPLVSEGLKGGESLLAFSVAVKMILPLFGKILQCAQEALRVARLQCVSDGEIRKLRVK